MKKFKNHKEIMQKNQKIRRKKVTQKFMKKLKNRKEIIQRNQKIKIKKSEKKITKKNYTKNYEKIKKLYRKIKK